jgi:L-rhamnose mutarotase
MIRRAFTMRLKPGAEAEYRYHHDNVWPDLVVEIEKSGIASITTFQRGLDLFLISEIADETAWDKLWTSEIHRRWAEVMEPLMHLRDDGIVDAGPLEEIFHLSTRVASEGNKKAGGASKPKKKKAALRGTKGAPSVKKKAKTPPAKKVAGKRSASAKRAKARRS